MPATPDAATEALIDLAFAEDFGARGDITGEFFIDAVTAARGHIVARQDCVIAGTAVAARVFAKVDPTVSVEILIGDGGKASRGDAVMALAGPARSLLAAERIALNFLQRLSAVATVTRRFVDAVEGSGVAILDTRKTTPGWRGLEKAAVRAGGGRNHRMGLYDMAMVKDNHLLASGDLASLQAAIDRLRVAYSDARVELEADRLDQLGDFLTLRGVDVVLLDNMDDEQLRRAVALRAEKGSKILLEASGGVTLETVAAIAATGIDFISVGALTHSAPAIDLALDFGV